MSDRISNEEKERMHERADRKIREKTKNNMTKIELMKKDKKDNEERFLKKKK